MSTAGQSDNSPRANPGGDSEPSHPALLPMGVRAWTRGPADPHAHKSDLSEQPHEARTARGRPKRRYPREVLVFDTETRNEPGQGLLFGVWRLYRDNLDDTAASFLVEEGIFFPDDLPTTDSDAWAILQDYVATRPAPVAPGQPSRLALMPVSEWLKERLHTYGYKHRDNCDVVGFNLPFDLGALARHYGPAMPPSSGRGLSYYPGWSLSFAGRLGDDGTWTDTNWRPRIKMRSIDPRRTLIGWAQQDDVHEDESEQESGKRRKTQPPRNIGNGRFVDLRTLAFALTDRSLTLESACALFGHPYRKREIEYGVITPDALEYGREDVAATATLYTACLTELEAHTGVELPPHRLYSPATVGARYLDAMGLPHPLDRFDLSDEYLGACMSAFYGGRAEARVIRTPVPVVLVDFTSMYPAQNALLRTWELLTAADVEHENVTDHVRKLIESPDLFERLHRRETWREDIGVTFVEIVDIDGAVLPVRARYESPITITSALTTGVSTSGGTAAGNLGIGINPLHYDGTLVYALPDILAAALLGPPAFRIAKATRLRPVGGQVYGLRPVELRGDVMLDTAGRDPFLTMIEQRHTVRADTSRDVMERERLDLFLKITANATSYGSLARFDRNDRATPVPVRAYGPDGVRRSVVTKSPEKPGPYCFPPVAASITAGARLTLAMMETHLTRLGGSYAFMDTDSTAIIANPDGTPITCPGEPGGTLATLSHAQVYEILHAFDDLNPYGPEVTNPDPEIPRSPWKIEKDSLHDPLVAYVISAKRYLLYRGTTTAPMLVDVGPDANPIHDIEDLGDAGNEDSDTESGHHLDDTDDLIAWSEHGIGLYQDPLGARDEQGRRIWIRQAWNTILSLALAPNTGDQPAPAASAPKRRVGASAREPSDPVGLPDWATQPAITQFTIASPRQLAWFGRKHSGEPTPKHPRPASFGLLAQTAPMSTNPGPISVPVAPFTSQLDQWTKLPWRDRSTGQPLILNTADPDTQPDLHGELLAQGAIELRTLGHVLHHYQRRTEHKSLASDGTPTGPFTRGKLRRRPVHANQASTLLIGKESNKLAERLTGTDTGQHPGVVTYGAVGDYWVETVLPVLEEIGSAAVAKRLGVSERRARDIVRGRARPHAGASGHMQTLLHLVDEHFASQLSRSSSEESS